MEPTTLSDIIRKNMVMQVKVNLASLVNGLVYVWYDERMESFYATIENGNHKSKVYYSITVKQLQEGTGSADVTATLYTRYREAIEREFFQKSFYFS